MHAHQPVCPKRKARTSLLTPLPCRAAQVVMYKEAQDVVDWAGQDGSVLLITFRRFSMLATGKTGGKAKAPPKNEEAAAARRAEEALKQRVRPMRARIHPCTDTCVHASTCAALRQCGAGGLYMPCHAQPVYHASHPINAACCLQHACGMS